MRNRGYIMIQGALGLLAVQGLLCNGCYVNRDVCCGQYSTQHLDTTSVLSDSTVGWILSPYSTVTGDTATLMIAKADGAIGRRATEDSSYQVIVTDSYSLYFVHYLPWSDGLTGHLPGGDYRVVISKATSNVLCTCQGR